jgi:carbon monoxide dehydrogenase subunit G
VSRTFEFGGTWEVAAPVSAVHDALVDLEHYPAWWPQVVAVASLGPDDARVLCRSALPYTLDLVLHAASRSSEHLRVDVAGDLHGTVAFDLTPTPTGTRLDLTQSVRVSGAFAAAAYVAAPLLRWNHDRMMRGCITGLRTRLAPSGG